MGFKSLFSRKKNEYGNQEDKRCCGNASNTFEAFYEGWLVRQEHFLDELLSAQQTIDEARDEDLQDLVSWVLFHYHSCSHSQPPAYLQLD
ncbi:hypothetical protein ACFX12_008824 [Malus domestica]